MHYLISIVNIFYFSFFISLLFFGWALYLFFKEKFKEVSIRLFVFYILNYFLFCNLITYFYVEDVIFLLSIWLEENFIVKDPNDWVWALFTVSLFLAFIFFIPYVIFILYTLIASGFYWNEQKIIWFFSFFFFYNFFLSGFLLLTDFLFAGISSLAGSEKLPFEFQLEIENFVFFVFGTYTDFFFSLFIFNFFVFNLLFKYKIKTLNSFNLQTIIIFVVVTLLFIFYWFGGVSIVQDSILLVLSFFFLLLIKWLQLFLGFLSKYKEN